MFIPLRGLGRLGVIPDSQGQALPVGAWADARNVRFSGLSMEKMLEPDVANGFEFPGGNAQWMQMWSNGLSTHLAVATSNEIWLYKGAPDPDDVTWEKAGGPYITAERGWQSFEWGTTCIFNNGFDVPQIFNPDTQLFEDLPGWGIISNADDLTNGNDPSVNTNARCRWILPYKSFLVAGGVYENGQYQPNTVWWSDASSLVGYDKGPYGTGGPPNWDYESPGSLSGKTEVSPGDGAITWGAVLNENLIVYTEGSATAMQAVGGGAVMSFRRLFNKGCAGLHLAVEFNNRHFVVSGDQIYVHDGSTVQLIAKDRVEDEFWHRAGKGGRYNTGKDSTIDFVAMQLVKNPDRKEIYLSFNHPPAPNPEDEPFGPVREALVYNFEDDNYTWMDASVVFAPDQGPVVLLPVVCMGYGFEPGYTVLWSDLETAGTTWQELKEAGTKWSDFYFHPKEENMFWLTPVGFFKSDQAVDTSGMKEYFVTRDDVDLDDVVQQWTSHNYKYSKQAFLHIEQPNKTAENVPNRFSVTMGAKNNLMDDPQWRDPVVLNLNKTSNSGDHKVDYRVTGRYLAIRFDFGLTGEIRLSGMEIDAEEAHGR